MTTGIWILFKICEKKNLAQSQSYLVEKQQKEPRRDKEDLVFLLSICLNEELVATAHVHAWRCGCSLLD